MKAILRVLTSGILSLCSPLYTYAESGKEAHTTPKKEEPTAGVTLHQEKPALAPEKPSSAIGAPSTAAPPGTFNLGVAETRKLSAAEEANANRLKTMSNEAIQKEANDAYNKHDLALARQLYDTLCQRDPKNSAYFAGAGSTSYDLGDFPSAYADLITAWHLAGSQNSPNTTAYANTAQLAVDKLQQGFKLSWGYEAGDPALIVNAATRLWKAGYTKESIQMNEYALKNEPLCAQIAAYNLGAMAESAGEYKKALPFYLWAGQKSHQLESEVGQYADPKLSAQITKGLTQLPTWYIDQAVRDTQRALKAKVNGWHGWDQGTTSDICPLCAISRTQPDYRGMQDTLTEYDVKP